MRAVTLADVATAAGLSKSTASLVFRGDPVVSDRSRERVLHAAAALGYVYNRRAASLRMHRTGTIGLLTPGQSNAIFGDLTTAVEEALAPHGYGVLLGNTLESASREAQLVRTLMEFRVDGVLVVPVADSDHAWMGELERLYTPAVVMTRRLDDARSSYVGSDDSLGGRLAAEHLIGHHCASIGYFGGPAGVFTHVDRTRAVRERAAEAGIAYDDVWSRRSITSSDAGFELARSLLRERRPPEGLICHSDVLALGVFRALREAGYEVSRDVRVIGFDDVSHARHWSPPLTTVKVNVQELARTACEMIVRLIADDAAVSSRLMEPALVVRESCGCLGQAA